MSEWGQLANDNSQTYKQLLAIAGAALQFIGVFLPIVSVPLLGTQNYFQNGKGDGIIILVLSVISIVLATARLFPGLWVTGLSSNRAFPRRSNLHFPIGISLCGFGR
jgi:hypothetical protein